MFVCWPKAMCECCRQEAFPKVPNSPKFPASLAMGFIEKKTRCGIACVPGDWEDATRFVLVVSFRSDIDGPACARKPHTHTLHTIHTHTHSTVKESCLAWFVVADHEEGEAEVKKVESVLLCLGKRAVLELQAVHDQLLWLFDNVRKLLKQELHKSALEHWWSECSSSTSRLIWSPKRHFVAIDLPVAEKTPKCMCYPILGQRKLKANNVVRQPASTKAQSSSCFDLDSDRVTVLVPRQTEVSISVWGKPSVLGNSLLSTNQRPFIYTGPQALSWRPSTIRSQVGPGSRLTHSSSVTSYFSLFLFSPPPPFFFVSLFVIFFSILSPLFPL